MSVLIIELNDAGVSVSDGDQVMLVSPGYAVLDGDRLYLGNEAQDMARIRPRWTNNRFWSKLDTASMPGATPQLRHHADLAYNHLKRIWEQVGEQDAEVVFAVPGSWKSEQLGLLLGFADDLGLNVRSMVDAAVAASASTGGRGKLHVLDISLHRILLTGVVSDGSARRDQISVVSEDGLVHFNNLWADTIADQFVRATRFDPMHRAETEQRLHDRLHHCLDDLTGQTAAVVELDDGDKHYSVTVRRDQLAAAAAAAYPRIVQHLKAAGQGGERLLLASRFELFPGLLDALSLLPDLEVEVLAEGAAARGCLAGLESLPRASDGVHFYTEVSAGGAVTAKRDRTPAATHLLYRGQAWTLSDRPVVLALGSDDEVRRGGDQGTPQCTVHKDGSRVWMDPMPQTHVRLNDREVDDQVALEPGDRLHFGDHREPVQVISLTS